MEFVANWMLYFGVSVAYCPGILFVSVVYCPGILFGEGGGVQQIQLDVLFLVY
jgi:hypothetical protein